MYYIANESGWKTLSISIKTKIKCTKAKVSDGIFFHSRKNRASRAYDPLGFFVYKNVFKP